MYIYIYIIYKLTDCNGAAIQRCSNFKLILTLFLNTKNNKKLTKKDAQKISSR